MKRGYDQPITGPMNFFQKWSLRSRILAAATAAFAITGLCAIQLHQNLAALVQNQQWVTHTIRVVSNLKAIQSALVDIETGSRGFAVGGDDQFLEPYETGVNEFSRLLAETKSLVADNPEQVGRLTRLGDAQRAWLDGVVKAEIQARRDVLSGDLTFASFSANFNRAEGKDDMDAMRALVAEMVRIEEELMGRRDRDYIATVKASQLWASWGLSISIAVGFALLGAVVIGAARSLVRISDSLNDGSNQVAAAASQVASSSQQLAQGASEQAASIEETSASLEETSGMTRQSAESAQTAKELATQASHAAQSGADDVRSMNSAMTEISDASREMVSIIKTIDEIAFQTNILALNAAVEAARAGGAGAGFAVVAEEVRALAQRSAEAAREITGRIEVSTQRTAKGVGISEKLGQSFQLIVDACAKVDQLVAEIATSSREQRSGIEQIGGMMTRIDKITQGNAAQAEESASAAEELNAQSAVLKETLGELLAMAGRRRADDPAARIASASVIAAPPSVAPLRRLPEGQPRREGVQPKELAQFTS